MKHVMGEWSKNVERILEEVKAERIRQIEVEGYKPEHDDEHDSGELADAGAAYIVSNETERCGIENELGSIKQLLWKLDRAQFKASNAGDGHDDVGHARRRDLIKGITMAVAEIERLDRINSAEKKK